MTFNPHFLSITFETWVNGCVLAEVKNFQSSFSEYHLWNNISKEIALAAATFQSSFSEYHLWNLISFGSLRTIMTFNPHFLSITFETLALLTVSTSLPSFNPHFLSITFETPSEPGEIFYQISLSILIFWVSPLKHRPRICMGGLTTLSILIFWVSPLKHALQFNRSEFIRLSILIFWVSPLKHGRELLSTQPTHQLSILIFWVSPLKQANIVYLPIGSMPFNPHFLSITFETYCLSLMSEVRKDFQSSFSEYHLWNEESGLCIKLGCVLSILIFWVSPLKLASGALEAKKLRTFNPHFLSITFETLHRPLRGNYLRGLSILIFWVSPLKPSTAWRGLGLLQTFNPHFLSITFETADKFPSFHPL